MKIGSRHQLFGFAVVVVVAVFSNKLLFALLSLSLSLTHNSPRCQSQSSVISHLI